MINLKRALLDPSSIFSTPEDVLLNSTLSRDQKIQILRRWESDVREIQVAEEENMLGDYHLVSLEQIRNALHTLDAFINTEDVPPTKQGG